MRLSSPKAEWLLLIPICEGETVGRVRHGRKEQWGLDPTGTPEEQPPDIVNPGDRRLASDPVGSGLTLGPHELQRLPENEWHRCAWMG